MSQDNVPQQPGTPGPAPYAYSPYPQYAYGYNADTEANKTLRDYLMIVRERAWYLVLAVFVCTVGALLYNQSIMAEYMATARFQIYRSRIQLASTAGTGETTNDTQRIIDDRDFNTQITAMNSMSIIDRVAKRLNQDERKEVLQPYQDGNIFSGALTQQEVIMKCRKIVPERQTFIANVQYTHPNRELARKMADYFVQEIKRANEEANLQNVDPLVERLRIQLDQMKEDIRKLAGKRNKLVEDKKIMSLVAGTNTAQQELTSLTQLNEGDKRAYEEATANMSQLADAKAKNRPTKTIPFISKDESVNAMTLEASRLGITLSAAQKKYTDKHPNVISLQQQLDQANKELDKAVKLAEEKLDSTYRTSKSNYENSSARLKEKQEEITKMQSAFTEYEAISKDIKVSEDNLNRLSSIYELKRADQAVSATPIVLIDNASGSDKPVNKNLFIALGAGLVLGTGIGLGIIFLLSALDDRVKSASDIEHFVGIPLIGVIPKIAKLDNFRKARTVSTNADRATTEAFHAIYSALKIHEQASKAKAILTTSTTPSEGKSFFTTNLAMTYALHGEKVIVVDADLRLPNVARSLQLEGDNGITKYQAGMITLDEAIRKDVVPNMDVLPVGASCKNPTQVLNSKKFAAMIEELKGRYDRVFIDSPPVGAVADSLNLMPQVDGALYVVKFNTVKRKSIKGNLRRLKESKVPVFGAILNQIGLHVANHYTNTYDKAYNKYYHDNDPHAVEVKVED